ncbi:hypothetical protein LEN26_013138 [Aphanomyces euteiches]|nr:hypothetical protein LEN26_013138 [Aphanomyces euteiches]
MFDWNFERNGDIVRRMVNANANAMLDNETTSTQHDVVQVGDVVARLSHPGRTNLDPVEWTLVGEFKNLHVARDIIALSIVYATRAAKCAISVTKQSHRMKARYLRCKCRESCKKLSKIVQCMADERCVLYVHGQNGECASIPQGHLTKVIKAEAEKLFEMGATPSQALSKLTATVPPAQMPPLKKLQNCYRYFRHHNMQEHSNTSVMTHLLVERFFHTGLDENQAFSFGYNIVDGYPSIGYGGSDGPFKVGITTMSLLRRMDRDPSSFLFHWDATYKLNVEAYPVLVCGITDVARNFHPVAFFILGKESESEYAWAIESLMEIFTKVTGRQLLLTYVMADAGRAPALAIESRRNQLGVANVLMCFYHVISNVQSGLLERHRGRRHSSTGTFIICTTAEVIMSSYLIGNELNRSSGIVATIQRLLRRAMDIQSVVAMASLPRASRLPCNK